MTKSKITPQIPIFPRLVDCTLHFTTLLPCITFNIQPSEISMENSMRFYLFRTLARLPLLLLMFILDMLLFQTLIFPFIEQSTNFAWIYQSFWLFHSALYLGFIGMQESRPFAREEPLARDFRATLLGLYLSKGLGLALFAVIAIIMGATSGMIGLLGGNLNLETAWVILRFLSILFAVGLFVSLFYGMLRNRYRFKLHKVTVPISGLPEELDGFTLVQFSDAHLGSFSRPEAIRPGVELINAQEADVVCFTGDLVNNLAEEARPFLKELSQIKAQHGVVAILGNHDYGDYVRWSSPEDKARNLNDLVNLHSEMNWRLLRDESLQLKVKGQELSIIGVENISGRGQFKNYGNLEKAYPETSDTTKILLTHDPSHWRSEVLDYKDITLSLSGHTHGFQFGIEIGNWLKWSPVKWVYKEWAGLYQEGEQYLYVNRGFGFLGYPGRVGILPEITRIELKCKKDS